jgi:hypothetical protein
MSTAMSSEWHVDADVLRQWVDGIADPAMSISVEQHVLRCAKCRADVALVVRPESLQETWDAVIEAIETPAPSPAERLLTKVGVSRSDALVVASAATLRAAWFAAVIGVLAFTVFGAIVAGDGIAFFLFGAPLIPVAGVAAIYGPSSDPAYELAVAAPYVMFRLVLLRTAAVLATSVPLVIGAGLLLPTSAATAFAWLLPATAFIAAVLTASIWVDPLHAAGVIASGWFAVMVLVTRHGDPLDIFGPNALIAYLVVFAVAAAVLVQRLLGAAPSWRLR